MRRLVIKEYASSELDSIILQTDLETKIPCSAVIEAQSYGEDDIFPKHKSIVGFLTKNGEIISANDVNSSFPNDDFAESAKQIEPFSFANFTLAIKVANKPLEIQRFDNVEQVNAFVRMNYPELADFKDYAYKDGYGYNGKSSQKFNDIELNLNTEPFLPTYADNNLLFVENLDLSYTGLQFNGVDYECNKALVARNDYIKQVLGFVCKDGEIIDIKDPLLDGIHQKLGQDCPSLIMPNDVDVGQFEYNDKAYPNNNEPVLGEDYEECFLGRWSVCSLDGKNIANFLTNKDLAEWVGEQFDDYVAMDINLDPEQDFEDEKFVIRGTQNFTLFNVDREQEKILKEFHDANLKESEKSALKIRKM